jgi:predicted nucleotidyltransferase
MYGLKDIHIKKISTVFSNFKEIDKVILYGSRARCNYQHSSDIDLSLVGNDLNLNMLLKIENKLDDLLLPYKIDLSIFSKIEDPDLIEHINRVGIIFYQKAEPNTGDKKM